MNQPISILREKNKPLAIEIPAMPSWDGFDKLTNFLIEEYSTVVLVKADGPDARRWVLESNGSQFELIHDDLMGNKLMAPTADTEELILRIGHDLEERLMGDLLEIDDNIQGRILKTEESAILTFWRPGNGDLTRKIYDKLQNHKLMLDVQLFGAPYSYGLLITALADLDKLLDEIKMIGKSDLNKSP